MIRNASLVDWGKLAADRLSELASISEPGPGVTRLPFTPEHRAALKLLTLWMEEAGLAVHLDNAGTLVGRHEGAPGAGTLYLGSHQDSVREGGAYDGIMGIVLPILAMTMLKDAGTLPRYSVEVLAFADEEGVRWPTALIGSRALAGTFDPKVLNMTDRDGITLRAAIKDFGLNPDLISEICRPRQAALGYLEAHIEQGPVLQEQDAPVGVVTAICGIERHKINLTGETGHAGTLPMASRRGALVGAATNVTEVNQLAEMTTDLRATVGELHVSPNVVNAVLGQVSLTVELRSPDDATRSDAGDHMLAFARMVAAENGLGLRAERTYTQSSQPCDAHMTTTVAQAITEAGLRPIHLPSGATHDASAMADLCSISMLFVRCRNGISHSPKEHTEPRDLGHAADVLTRIMSGIVENV